MRQAILKGNAGRSETQDLPVQSANAGESWFAGLRGKEKSAGWSERRLKVHSALHRGDWKLATILYLVLMFIVAAVVYS